MGFSLIEVLLALALTALIVTGVAGGLMISDRLVANSSGRTTARLMGEECLAVVRWMRDVDGLDALAKVAGRAVIDTEAALDAEALEAVRIDAP